MWMRVRERARDIKIITYTRWVSERREKYIAHKPCTYLHEEKSMKKKHYNIKSDPWPRSWRQKFSNLVVVVAMEKLKKKYKIKFPPWKWWQFFFIYKYIFCCINNLFAFIFAYVFKHTTLMSLIYFVRYFFHQHLR
jgi:hypothetical protein